MRILRASHKKAQRAQMEEGSRQQWILCFMRVFCGLQISIGWRDKSLVKAKHRRKQRGRGTHARAYPEVNGINTS
jgi:hypothetical protein